MKQPPRSGKVVFVDWHNVLSRDPFWMSISGSTTHPLRDQLDASLAEVFRTKAPEWMKGMLTSEDIIRSMNIKLDGRFRGDYLARRLRVDCAKMRVNTELLRALDTLKSAACVVLATDNMDCFARTFDRVRRRRRRSTPASETLADWAFMFDDIICSSDVAALKAEDPQRFFGPWLRAHGADFADAVLIDDRTDNCEAFVERGGRAIQYALGHGEVPAVLDSLVSWIDDPAAASGESGD